MDDVELTEMVEIQIESLHLVGKGANGFPSLLAKAAERTDAARTASYLSMANPMANPATQAVKKALEGVVASVVTKAIFDHDVRRKAAKEAKKATKTATVTVLHGRRGRLGDMLEDY